MIETLALAVAAVVVVSRSSGSSSSSSSNSSSSRSRSLAGGAHGRARNSHEKRSQGIILNHFAGLAGEGPRKSPNTHGKTSPG